MNPAYFTYSRDDNVEALAGPSAVFVAHYANLKNPAFQRAREKGAWVIVYRNLLNVTDTQPSDEERQWYMGDSSGVPLWLAPDGTPRSNWPGAKMIDIRPGSAWLPPMEDGIAQLIKSDLADGMFCDSQGARPWSSLAAWDTWSQAEQTEWALGCVDTARRADLIRRQLNERFTIVHNGNWILPAAHPVYARALEGERYCDGICLEHKRPTQIAQVAYAARAYGSLGQRRVIVIANNIAEALQWAVLPGVTHVASVDATKNENYQRAVAVPDIEPTDIRLGELQAYAERVEAERDSLRAQAGQKDGRVDELTAKLAAAEGDLSAARARIAIARQQVVEAATALEDAT